MSQHVGLRRRHTVRVRGGREALEVHRFGRLSVSDANVRARLKPRTRTRPSDSITRPERADAVPRPHGRADAPAGTKGRGRARRMIRRFPTGSCVERDLEPSARRVHLGLEMPPTRPRPPHHQRPRGRHDPAVRAAVVAVAEHLPHQLADRGRRGLPADPAVTRQTGTWIGWPYHA